MRIRFSMILLATILVSITIALTNLNSTASGAIVYVDAVNGNNTTGSGSISSPWKTITHALSHVTAGGTIMVQPGTYNATLGESFPINLPAGISLIGSGRDAAIIAGQSDKSVVYVGSASIDFLSNTVVSSITLQGGNAGLQIYSSEGHIASPTIMNARIRWNSTGIVLSTSGVYQNGATIAPTITDTEVLSNTQSGIYINSYGYFSPSSIAPNIYNSVVQGNGSHGIDIEAAAVSENGTSATPYIVGTLISNNGGHGIYVTGSYQGWGNPQIERSWITGNSGFGFYWSQGINTGNINSTITNSVIARNQNGGIFLGDRSPYSGGGGTIRLVNNTLTGNSIYGIYWTNGTGRVQPAVINSIIWNNAADDLFATSGGWSTNEVQYSDIQDGDLIGQQGNFSSDPVLRDDYHLVVCSPAIDAGTLTGAPSDDIDGNPRPSGSAPDVGAFEQGTPCLLHVSEDVSSPHARYGDILTYSVALSNSTTITPLNVLLTDTLSSSLAYQADTFQASQGIGHFASGVITWSDVITPGGTVTLNLQTRIVRANTIQNSITANTIGYGLYLCPAAKTSVDPLYAYLPIMFKNYCAGPLTDDFSNPASGWPIADTTYWSYGYLNGEYRFYAKDSAFGAVTRGDQTGRFIVEVDAHQVSATTGSFGIVFQLNDDWSEFYTFEIYPAQQQFMIWHYVGNQWILADYGTSGAILPGQNTNRLRIAWLNQVVGSDGYGFYVNGTLLRESLLLIAPTPIRRVGLTATADAGGFDVRFDNYKFVPEGCPENYRPNIQQSDQSPNNLFEMPAIQLSIPQEWPLRMTRIQPPVGDPTH